MKWGQMKEEQKQADHTFPRSEDIKNIKIINFAT